MSTLLQRVLRTEEQLVAAADSPRQLLPSIYVC